jgi:hypothetical protein
VFWAGTPLRSAVENLSQAQGVAVFLDRRVDPNQKLALHLKETPLETVFQKAADRLGLGMAQVGSVIYLGPPQAAHSLRPVIQTLERSVRMLPRDRQRTLFQAKPLVWQDFASPRELLQTLAEGNFELDGLDKIPHDLWVAANLPPLTLVERLSLIAIQWDQTFDVSPNGKRWKLTAIPASVPEVPETRNRSTPRRLPPTAHGKAGELRIKRLAIQSEPLAPVLKQLCDRLGLELQMDAAALKAAGVSLDQRVSLTVENVTIDELFTQLLKEKGLTFERSQKMLIIRPVR